MACGRTLGPSGGWVVVAISGRGGVETQSRVERRVGWALVAPRLFGHCFDLYYFFLAVILDCRLFGGWAR